MKMQKTRRESLGLFGAVGWAALSGCGGTTETRRPNAPGIAGMNEAGTGNAVGGDNGQGLGGDGASAGEGSAGGTGGRGAAGEGAAGEATAGAGGAASSECAAKAETVIGPYPTLGPLERKDVRGNTSGDTTPKAGAPLTLRVRVLDRDALCAPIEGAMVEIWQCDAVGAYAGYAAFSTVGQDFCRGAQRSDASGVAELLTIFPGSYAGRAVHIHFSIRKDAGTLPSQSSGQSLADIFVAQLYFSDEVTAQIFGDNAIYQQGAPLTPNESDGIFAAGGAELIVDVRSSAGGYVGEVTVGVRRSEIGL
jgi:protocatechuate 3,4-dioxygenase beta subunit